ncbi:MAG: hypothetical protein ACLS7A_01960, partial [Christensenellales bacterium]
DARREKAQADGAGEFGNSINCTRQARTDCMLSSTKPHKDAPCPGKLIRRSRALFDAVVLLYYFQIKMHQDAPRIFHSG